MSTYSTQPENFNYFNPIGFKFEVDKLPNVNFFCQSARLPGLTLGEATQPNPFRDIPTPGDKILFEELTIRFVVDEELENWLEMKEWIFGLGYPNSTDEYNELSKTNNEINNVIKDQKRPCQLQLIKACSTKPEDSKNR